MEFHQSNFYGIKNFCANCGREVNRINNEDETKCQKCGAITIWDFYLGMR